MNQVINLGTEAAEKVTQVKVNKQLHDLQLRVYLLETLLKKIDPRHTYIWSDEYGAFIREELNEEDHTTG